MRFSRRDALLRTAAVTAAGLIPGAAVPSLAAPPRLQFRNDEIDAALQARVDAAEVPGVVAMAATEHSVIYQGAFGVRSIGARASMSADTVFSIASMTKLLTSVAAMQLVERGKLKLDEPAARIDPTLGSPQVLDGFDAQGTPQLRAARKPITLRHLLTHTSGFSYQLWDANVIRYGKAARNNPALPRTPLMFDPDTRWAYGGSLDRVGRLVEIISGQNLDRYFHDHILGPLGMNDTSFALTENAARTPGKSASAQGGWNACAAASGETSRAESVFGWRRYLFHRAGLPDPASGAVEWRRACREKHPSATDGCADVHQSDRQR